MVFVICIGVRRVSSADKSILFSIVHAQASSRVTNLDPGALLRMTKHWSRECTRYAIGLKWTTVFIQRSLRASSAIWTILASRLLSRASHAFTFHEIPQMESLLAGYIQRTLSLPRSRFCLVARVTRQQRLAWETSAHSVQWRALNANRFLIVWNENCRIYDKWKFYLLVSVKNNGTQLPFFLVTNR